MSERLLNHPETEPRHGRLFVYCDSHATIGFDAIKKRVQELSPNAEINRINLQLYSRKIVEKLRISDNDSLLWMMEVVNSQQINELYALWSGLKKKRVKSVFVILDARKTPTFESEVNRQARESAEERLTKMKGDPNNQYCSLTELVSNPGQFKLLLEFLTKSSS